MANTNDINRLIDMLYERIEDAKAPALKPNMSIVDRDEMLDLLEYDKKNNTDNYHILYTYLQSNRKTTEAAKVLHMHRNNVTYRVKRIEELFGLDLEDPQMRLKVQYSFCILDLL